MPTFTDNLNITQVADNQTQKELTINTAINALDNAQNRTLAVVLVANASTLTQALFTRNFRFKLSQVAGLTGTGTFTVPLSHRAFVVSNADASFSINVKGATGAAVNVAANTTVIVFCDGTDCLGVTIPGVTYANLPVEVQNVPIAYPFSGKPLASQIVCVPIAQSLTMPVDFTGGIGYSDTNASASAVFTLSYLRGGVPTTIGTVTFTSAGSGGTFSTQAAVNLLTGDILKLTAPASQDGTLANVGITFMTKKV